MASLVRFVAVALTAVQLGCSSTEGGPGADVPEYVGDMPDAPAGTGGTEVAPAGVSPGDPALTSGGVGGNGSEGPPLNPPLTTGEMPANVAETAGVGGGSGGAEALPPPAAGAGGTGEIPVSPA